MISFRRYCRCLRMVKMTSIPSMRLARSLFTAWIINWWTLRPYRISSLLWMLLIKTFTTNWGQKNLNSNRCRDLLTLLSFHCQFCICWQAILSSQRTIPFETELVLTAYDVNGRHGFLSFFCDFFQTLFTVEFSLDCSVFDGTMASDEAVLLFREAAFTPANFPDDCTW